MTGQSTERVNFIATEIRDDIQHNQHNDLSRVIQGLDPKGDEFKAIQAALGTPNSRDGLPPLTLNMTSDGQTTSITAGNNTVASERYNGTKLRVTDGQVTNVDGAGVIQTRDSNNVTRTFDPNTGREVSVVTEQNSGNRLSETVRNEPGGRPVQIKYFPGTDHEQTVSFNADGYAIPGHGMPAEARVDAGGVARWDADGKSFTQNPDGTRSYVPFGSRSDPDALTTYYGPNNEPGDPTKYSSAGKNFERHTEADGSQTWWYTEDNKPGLYIPVKPPVLIDGVAVGYTINQSFFQDFDYQVGGTTPNSMRPA